MVSGELRTWHRLSITFEGPDTSEQATPNPFLDYRLTVGLTGPSGQVYQVPGFYAADGDAADTSASAGNKWRIYFVPDEAGEWIYQASFRQGPGVAVSLSPSAGTPTSFDGETGVFEVLPTNKTGNDFRSKGMLQYVGEHYLRFAETGEYYLKTGTDSPENFLAYHEFDGTYDTGGIEVSHLVDGLHRYEPHVTDWTPGDPVWKDGKGKGIIGALNYLASVSVNSVYFITYNLDNGDGQDVWMWTDENERLRFDTSKLDQWEIVFSHMDSLGIQLHVQTQERENQNILDNGELGTIRKLYYRELAARYSHHLALVWSIGEENSQTDGQRKDFAAYIRSVDPYDHPILFHTENNDANIAYQGIYGDANFEGASIQAEGRRYNDYTNLLREETALAGRPWFICGDEQVTDWIIREDMSNIKQVRSDVVWGCLMAGGAGIELIHGDSDGPADLQTEDFRTYDLAWRQMGIARDFIQTFLPYWEMVPDNTLINGTLNYVLAKEGEIYAIYYTDDDETKLQLPAGTFSLEWFNPETGGAFVEGTVTILEGPGGIDMGLQPAGWLDAVALVRRIEAGVGDWIPLDR